MKNKSVKRLAKLLFEESRKLEKPLSIREDFESSHDWCDYNKEVSMKFKKLISNTLSYAQNLNIRVKDDRITISSDDYRSIKNSSSRSHPVRPHIEENHLEIQIIKDLGFTINQGYVSRTSFRDKNIYCEIKDQVINRMREINSESFNKIWSSIMTETGLSRDNNLDDILNG